MTGRQLVSRLLAWASRQANRFAVPLGLIAIGWHLWQGQAVMAIVTTSLVAVLVLLRWEIVPYRHAVSLVVSVLVGNAVLIWMLLGNMRLTVASILAAIGLAAYDLIQNDRRSHR